MENLTKKIAAALQSAILIAVKVKLVEPRTLERSAGKSVRVIDKRVLDELFDLPENMVSVALLPIGYPSEKAKPSPLHSRNVSMEDMVNYL